MFDRKEYIERGALLQDIEETVVFSVKGGTETPTPEMRGARKVKERIEEATAADLVEVVRCEKCKFYEIVEYWHPDCNGTKQVCRLLKRQMQEDDFCSYGERKDEE